MKRPSPFVYIYSNPLIGYGLGGLAVWQGVAMLSGEASFLVPFILAGLASGSFEASERVQKFHRWNTEWNLMQGKRPFRIRIPGLHLILGAGLWAVLAYYVARHGADPDMPWPSALFWLGTAILAARGLYLLARRGGARPPRTKDVPVTLCLSKPQHAPGLRDAYAALPDYCAVLLRPRA